MTQATTQECVISRVFDAPRELVYQAFVDADQLAQWWGPAGCWLPREAIESDPRAGGHQRFVMRVGGRPELDIRNDITFTEVVENELLAGDMEVRGAPGHHGMTLRNTLRLEFRDEPGGKTRLELRQGPFETEEACEVHDAWLESFGKLDAAMSRTPPYEPDVTGRSAAMTEETMYELAITRVFDAPRELVYQAFVDPDQLAEWFGPVGFTVPRETVAIDARVGGYQRFVMSSVDDPSLRSPIDATFTEVAPNGLLVGEQEVIGIPGFEGVAKMTLRLEFHDEPGGKTRLELRQGPYSQRVEADARAGWMSSFTKLDSMLAAHARPAR
jgi:uncharacterized protein YndB with AHSA1/START domain